MIEFVGLAVELSRLIPWLVDQSLGRALLDQLRWDFDAVLFLKNRTGKMCGRLIPPLCLSVKISQAHPQRVPE